MKRLQFHLISFYLLLILGIVGCDNDRVESSLNTQLDSLLNEVDFSGGILITKRGEIAFERYRGIADRSWDIPNNVETRFDIASLNKSMIAALVVKSVEKGQLHLEDKLVHLLSAFPAAQDFNPEITIHQMLCHTSGLPDYDAVEENLRRDNFLQLRRMHFDNASYIAFISKLKPVAKPGERFHYSNFAYHLLSLILEEINKRPFASLLKTELCKPLGLAHTVSSTDNGEVIEKLAKAYVWKEEEGCWQENPFIDLTVGRRVFSTVSDMNRWGQVMSNPGYLTKNSLKLMQTNHLTEISKSISYGYGWVVIDADNKSEFGNLEIDLPYIIHGGSTEAYKSMLVNINQGEYVISFLSNAGSNLDELLLTKRIAKILLEHEN